MPVCSPLPLAGEGPGGEGRHWHTGTPHFVDAPALSPTLSRKREREHGIGIQEPVVAAPVPSFPCLIPPARLQPVVMHAPRQALPAASAPPARPAAPDGITPQPSPPGR